MRQRKDAGDLRAAGDTLETRHGEIALADRAVGWEGFVGLRFHSTIKAHCYQFVKLNL